MKRNNTLRIVTASAIGLVMSSAAHAQVTAPDTTTVVEYIMIALVSFAAIGVAKMTIAAAPAAYQALVAFIRR